MLPKLSQDYLNLCGAIGFYVRLLHFHSAPMAFCYHSYGTAAPQCLRSTPLIYIARRPKMIPLRSGCLFLISINQRKTVKNQSYNFTAIKTKVKVNVSLMLGYQRFLWCKKVNALHRYGQLVTKLIRIEHLSPETTAGLTTALLDKLKIDSMHEEKIKHPMIDDV